MSEVVIRAESLRKRYRIGAVRKPQTRFDSLRRWAGMLRAPTEEETLWALDGVSFEVKRGEVVGVIGRNGAGKSTLLKILSRITEPTEGRAEIRGRVGSLLEVGTGFHHELTGRENIFLNGAILGMKKAEIVSKFDEIVAFAEVERMIDTPLKYYSSGMFVRLAFAVAAHLETEILIVDEVLAVGDAEFQKKCLGKMDNVAHEGRTILFVSHSLGAVRRLCQSGLFLHNGVLQAAGTIEDVMAAYLSRTDTGVVQLNAKNIELKLQVCNAAGEPVKDWPMRTEIVIRVSVRAARGLQSPALDLAFYSEAGRRMFAVMSDRLEGAPVPRTTREFEMAFRLTNPGLACAQLTMDVGIREGMLPSYVGLWRGILALPVSLGAAARICPPDTAIFVPCALSAGPRG